MKNASRRNRKNAVKTPVKTAADFCKNDRTKGQKNEVRQIGCRNGHKALSTVNIHYHDPARKSSEARAGFILK